MGGEGFRDMFQDRRVRQGIHRYSEKTNAPQARCPPFVHGMIDSLVLFTVQAEPEFAGGQSPDDIERAIGGPSIRDDPHSRSLNSWHSRLVAVAPQSCLCIEVDGDNRKKAWPRLEGSQSVTGPYLWPTASPLEGFTDKVPPVFFSLSPW